MRSFLFILLQAILPVVIMAQANRESTHDSIKIAIAPDYDKVSGVHRFLFGESYRKLWAAPVTVKVLRLSEEKGGLKIVEKGGGLQTKSLRLKDKTGKEWMLRTIQKYPERGLPEKLKKTIARDILQDQVVTGHPFAALTVPVFAKALGIYHTNPIVVYVGDDPGLGQYRSEFANAVYLFEEREPAAVNKTFKTEELDSLLRLDNDKRMDQKLLLRARLLDLVLGDWDRHEGNWRWAQRKSGKEEYYEPIPRDRDKVFYSTSGIFPFLLSQQALKANLQPFTNNIRDIAHYNYNNRFFDRLYLNQLNAADWQDEIRFVQAKLTDNLIASAIKILPDTIYKLTGRKITTTLISRRNRLESEAMKYYRFLAKDVDVTATNRDERFEIKILPDELVAISIYKMNPTASNNKPIYSRTFYPYVTREVRLYGHDGNDAFTITGSGNSRIKLRMIGGNGVDSFSVAKAVNNKKKLFIYDRKDQLNYYPTRDMARLRTSTDTSVNKFDKNSFRYDKIGPVVALQFNRDQGAALKLGVVYEKQGFRKRPFAERHELNFLYATARNSFGFNYSAYLTKVLGKNDISINLLSRGPGNVSNFFGLGNESHYERNNNLGINYYRNRYDFFEGNVRLHRSLSQSVKINAGLATSYYTSTSKNNNNHYFNQFDVIHPEQKVYASRSYSGIVGGVEVDTRNTGLLPSTGVYWNTEIRALNEFKVEKKPFARIFSEFTFYIPITRDSVFVVANRIAGGSTIGNPAFFQQMQLGGVQNLRGFHNNRFTGTSMFYHNIDLRLKLFDFTSYLFPGTVGMIAFNDIGRVWIQNEKSNKIHHSYGGGIYIIPADLILLQAIISHSEEGLYPFVSIGFSF